MPPPTRTIPMPPQEKENIKQTLHTERKTKGIAQRRDTAPTAASLLKKHTHYGQLTLPGIIQSSKMASGSREFSRKYCRASTPSIAVARRKPSGPIIAFTTYTVCTVAMLRHNRSRQPQHHIRHINPIFDIQKRIWAELYHV